MPEFDKGLEREVRRLEADLEKSTPLAEWEYVEVEFPQPDMLVTIRHRLLGKGRLVFLPVKWSLPEPPTKGAMLYTLQGEEVQFEGYIKVRATVVGRATVLIGLRRDG